MALRSNVRPFSSGNAYWCSKRDDICALQWMPASCANRLACICRARMTRSRMAELGSPLPVRIIFRKERVQFLPVCRCGRAGPRDFIQVSLYLSGTTNTMACGMIIISARAGIHGSYECEAGRIFQSVFGT